MDNIEQKLKNLEDGQKRLEKLLLCQKTVLDFDELVEYTGFSRGRLYRLNMKGQIPGVSKPTGRRLYFKREKIDKWLLSNINDPDQ